LPIGAVTLIDGIAAASIDSIDARDSSDGFTRRSVA
jgi:hypothetical protein